jgi:hypothetical protein
VTEDIAKFGQLYIQKGVWNGKRVLPEAWVEEATRSHINNGPNVNTEWEQGYGYQFWRCRYGAYRGDGAFGQYCIVMPEQDAIVAITSAVEDMQRVMSLVWEHLLPAMKESPVSACQSIQTALRRKLASLSIIKPSGEYTSPNAERVSGRSYMIEDNGSGIKEVMFNFTGDGCTYVVHDSEKEYSVKCGFGAWAEGETCLPGWTIRIAACGSWQDEDTFVMVWRYIETPFYDKATCIFTGDSLSIEIKRNVFFREERFPAIKGEILKK